MNIRGVSSSQEVGEDSADSDVSVSLGQSRRGSICDASFLSVSLACLQSPKCEILSILDAASATWTSCLPSTPIIVIVLLLASASVGIASPALDSLVSIFLDRSD